MLESVGDDGNLEGVSCWIADCEAYAINGNTAFVNSEIAFQCHLAVLWIFESKIGRTISILNSNAASCLIHMALDNMTV